MGVSTDGIVAYGVPVEDESIPGSIPESRWEAMLEEWGDDEDLKRGFKIMYHCSMEYTMHFLAVPGTDVTASRGYPERVHMVNIEQLSPLNYEAWKNALDRFKIDRSEEGWYLFSFWG